MSVRVLHELLGYISTETENDEAGKFVNRSVLRLARLYAWDGTVVKSLTEQAT